MCKLLVKVEFSLFYMLYDYIRLFLPLVINLISKCCKHNTREADVGANNIVKLYVKYSSKRSSFFSHSDLTKSIITWTFQIKEYLGCAGLLLKTPATRKQILGCSYSSILKPILKENETKILVFGLYYYKMDQFSFQHTI